MKKHSLFIAATLLASCCFSQTSSSGNSETQEATFVVTVNNQEYILSEGEELEVESTRISVKLADHKTFDIDYLSFNYPSHFSPEYEKDVGYQNWILNGNDFVIMYFEIDAYTELDDFVDELVGQFGKSNCRVEKTSVKLGDKILDGKRINISLVGQKLTLDFLEVGVSDSTSRFIAFQDTKNDDGSDSEESSKTLKMIDRTVEYND
ncbi:MAG: hypothetical protein AB8B56_20940 [Crocinitomicaceae bacterium]